VLKFAKFKIQTVLSKGLERSCIFLVTRAHAWEGYEERNFSGQKTQPGVLWNCSHVVISAKPKPKPARCACKLAISGIDVLKILSNLKEVHANLNQIDKQIVSLNTIDRSFVSPQLSRNGGSHPQSDALPCEALPRSCSSRLRICLLNSLYDVMICGRSRRLHKSTPTMASTSIPRIFPGLTVPGVAGRQTSGQPPGGRLTLGIKWSTQAITLTSSAVEKRGVANIGHRCLRAGGEAYSRDVQEMSVA
jgi:hypothetical protein